MVEIDVRRRRRRARARARARPRRRRIALGRRAIAGGLRRLANKTVMPLAALFGFTFATTHTDRVWNLINRGRYELSLFFKDLWNNITLQRPVALLHGPEVALKSMINPYSLTGIALLIGSWLAGKFLKLRGLGLIRSAGWGMTAGGMIGGLFNLVPSNPSVAGGSGGTTVAGGGAGGTGDRILPTAPSDQIYSSPIILPFPRFFETDRFKYPITEVI